MIRRWTPLSFLWTERYLDPAALDGVEFEWWTTDYEWERDEWNGYMDLAQPVTTTLETERGDCEDYALVALSHAVNVGRDEAGLAVAFRGLTPRHVIAYDETAVYSSGAILRGEDPVSYLHDRDDYDYLLLNEVSP